MDFTITVWRQKSSKAKGQFETYNVKGIDPDMSFIEMLNILNQDLSEKNVEPVAFDCDCLEGICGSCSLMIDGTAHGPESGTTSCQLHMRSFKEGAKITIEPWRAKAFPVIKDLVVDRSSFDRIIQKGGFISVNSGGAPDANAVPISKEEADTAMDAAACIGCGACVAACNNSSAMLFTSAKLAQLRHLPQGQAERMKRTIGMVEQMDEEGFGDCSNQFECEAVCPKEISAKFIADMNKDYIKAKLVR